jgi:hypothetical protein
MKNAGNTVDLKDVNEILKVNSPKNQLSGPWFVVHTDVQDKWAIVVMHWKSNPCLGIRWFYGTQGTPSVRGYGTWLVIPNQLANAILDKLPISPQRRAEIDKILLGEYAVKELKKKYLH